MTTSANDPAAAAAAPSTPAPRRTIFGWSDMVTIRIPDAKAKSLAEAPEPAPAISFAPAEQFAQEREVAEVQAEIISQAKSQLAAKYGLGEFPQGWLIETLRERFDDPATIALLEVIASATRDDEPTMAIDPYWRREGEGEGEGLEGAITDLTAALVEVYEEWLEARPERMVPPETVKPARTEAMRLRRAGHEYWGEGEKGKAADCFAQALDKLLGPDPDALGATVMDHSAIRDSQAEFLAAWDRIDAQNRFLVSTRSPEFRRALLRGDRTNLTRGEIECLDAVRLSEDLDLQRLIDWRESTHVSMEQLRIAVRRTREGGLEISDCQDKRFRGLASMADSLCADLAALGVEARR